MTDEKDIYSIMPFIALINHISKNKLKYNQQIQERLNIIPEGRYLMRIYRKENLSQKDLVDFFGESKGKVAKDLRKLEDEGYVEREIVENNRRRYNLKLTKKGEDFAVLFSKDLKKWEETVGVSQLDDDTINKLRDIARKSEEILKD